jgi:hypothetical protein
VNGEVVKVTSLPKGIDLLSQVLGRTPTEAEALDFTSQAVAVAAFFAGAGAGPGDTLSMEGESWAHSVFFGLYENSGQKMVLRIEKDH